MGLDGVELVMAIEEEFGCDITDPEAERVATPRDLIDLLMAKQSRGQLFVKPARAPSYTQQLFDLVKPKQPPRSSPLSREEVAEKVMAITSEQLGISRDNITENSRYIEDMGVG